MLWLRGCPRCGGDLLDEHGYHGEVWVACLQCGGVLTAEEELALRRGTQRVERVVATA